MLTHTGVKKYSITFGISLLLACLGQNNARALALPDVPLDTFGNVEHNVLLTFDDSGSMSWGYLPDTISGDTGTRRFCSSEFNGLGYDPTTDYAPPPVRNNPGNLSATPVDLPNASFTGAWVNGFIAGSATIDLSTGYRPVSSLNVNSGLVTANSYATCSIAAAGVPAFYYIYDATLAGTAGCPAVAVNTDDDCYRLVQHNNPAALGTGSDPTTGAWSNAGTGVANQQTNFANWYTYYRVRNLAAKSAAGRAFRGVDTNMRLAGQHLNNGSATGGPASGITFTNTTSTNTSNVMKRFCDDPFNIESLCIDGSTARTDFFTRLYNSPANSSTPLRAAMQRAGNSFGSANTGAYSPYRDVPGAAVSATNPELSCRKNFHIMMTDGYWNGTATVAGNPDGTASTLPDGTAYTVPNPPYSDAWTSTLADNAFEYWYQDLRPDLTNNVQASERDAVGTAIQRYWNPLNNPATWQHMQTFTIGLGIPGTLTNDTETNGPTYTGLTNGTISWPQPSDGDTSGRNIDDLWHAAINGRGSYFSARNPGQMKAAIDAIVGQIGAATGSAAGLGATGSTTSGGGTSIFKVGYDAGSWAGRLISERVDTSGVPISVNWEAGTAGVNTLSYNSRKIITYNPTNAAGNRGVPFRWGSLSAAQQAALNMDPVNVPDGYGSQRLEYLRGASTNEGPGNPVNPTSLGFRERICYDPSTVIIPTNTSAIPCVADRGKLGDIINSSPVYVGKPVFDYPDTLESVTYSSFVAAQAGRQATVYVGANDGMLHAFRADTGIETLAYVPNLVYANATSPNNLSLLSYKFYSHRYYVDGAPTMGDVFIGGAWRTVLVGGLRKGGQGYYALDITDPAGFAESSADQIAKWEFPDLTSVSPDMVFARNNMGYSYSQPAIFKMASGQWAAVFGNGYNNTGTGRSMIFIVDIDTGNVIQTIDTGVSGGGGSVANPNGMATPAVVDLDDDFIADYIYAGDLLGKMWRIDVRSKTPSDWALATNVQPLFTAMDNANTPVVQPITTKPAVGFHPLGFGGLMVYFGSGKFLETSDNSATGIQQRQSFYAIYDRGVTGRKTEPSKPAPVVRADLLQQTISTTAAVGGFLTRNISNNPINWRLDRTSTTTHLGWYVDLPSSGEKQVTDSLLREGRILFTTNSPSSDACDPGGTGWLMALSNDNGGQLKETFDLNGDGIFSSLDNNTLAYGAAGTAVAGSGSLSSPIVLTNPPGAAGGVPPPPCKETVESQASNGDVLPIKIVCKPSARESWRQIR